MTTNILFTNRECSSVPSARSGHRALASAEATAVSMVGSAAPSMPGAGLQKHMDKRFAMAGINANVWPLSPQDWSSG